MADMTPQKLSPVMASRKLQALGFIKRYYLEHGASPSQREIASAIGVSQPRVQALVRDLERDGLVKRVHGQRRGIMLANRAKHVSAIDALLQLQDEGWEINLGRMELMPPLSFPSLPWPPELDHIPDVEIGDLNGGFIKR
jgi:SOS-response transcriptional repressor LexA